MAGKSKVVLKNSIFHSFIHPHPGKDKRPVKAAAV
jgi:hypothetical protein